MTDKMKMSMVGKRYLICDEHNYMAGLDSREVQLLAIYTVENEYWFHCKEVKWSSRTHVGKLEKFWDCFEEIEDQPVVKFYCDACHDELGSVAARSTFKSGSFCSSRCVEAGKEDQPNVKENLKDDWSKSKSRTLELRPEDCGYITEEYGAPIRKMGEKPKCSIHNKQLINDLVGCEDCQISKISYENGFNDALSQRILSLEERIKKLEEK